ncbi:3D domain-containing protein [Terrisporobacter vanillatitrophus]|uniref:3D domain-containing protein n=1 Tax=Terrisporobacter vanillatitrophus TaxID=3058402 RepID=UPI003368C0D8
MSYLNRKVKSIMLSGLLSMGIVTANYVAFNKEVVLIVYGQEIEVNSFQPDVQGVLEENEINYDENHIISEDLDASLKNGMKIEVKQVEKKTITETEDIPYDTVIKKDNSLLKGKIEVSQKGKKGTKELIYDAIYQNGKLVSKTLVEENTIEKAKDKIIKKGIKEKKKVKSTSEKTNSTKSSLGKKMAVSATAYSGDTITATGTVPKWGTIAVDPTVIPYGTKVYIPQFDKYFIAEDCGGGIKGNKIDIFMNSESQCNNWGKRTIDIYIVQ